MPFASVEEVLVDLREGKPIILLDDESRENEGDLVYAAEMITDESVAFMMREGRGLICLSITEERAQELGVPLQYRINSSWLGTGFAVSFDYKGSVDTAVTAQGRALTIRKAAEKVVRAEDFSRPGYVFPVISVPGGVLNRRGQTEGSVDLCRLAGLSPVSAICELMGADGKMLRRPQIESFADRHGFKMLTVEQLLQYRVNFDIPVRLVQRLDFNPQLQLGRFGINVPDQNVTLHLFADDVERREHLALIFGEPSTNVLTRVHSECLTGDVFGSRRCDCGYQLKESIRCISKENAGVLIYLRQEGRGIGLANKLRAYELQDKGLDTVEANLKLGFEPDLRSYRVAAKILSSLGISEVRLMSNNPRKLKTLEEYGIRITERIPIVSPRDEFNEKYLAAKEERLGHIF
jgi:3,4-dihydroxy 2-butanone 4-phosphate synthase/GTP cyclohydrolase II